MPLEPWKLLETSPVLSTRIFSVHRDTVLSPRRTAPGPVTRIAAPDWVNLVALTPDERIVLVRQWRHGIRDFTLEIPGGMVDPGEEPAQAAARELREETGYAGTDPSFLGIVHPNPAFLDNSCHTFLIEDCRRVGEQQQDPGEDIQVEFLPLADIPRQVAAGRITNSLVVCAFWWLQQGRPEFWK